MALPVTGSKQRYLKKLVSNKYLQEFLSSFLSSSVNKGLRKQYDLPVALELSCRSTAQLKKTSGSNTDLHKA